MATVPADPKIIRERYNISSTALGGNPANIQAVAAFMDNFYSPVDIANFFSLFWPGKEFKDDVSKVVGTNKPSSPTLLGNVGLEYVMGVAPNVPTWFWSNPGTDFWGDLTWWVNQLTASEAVPPIHLMIYGNQGAGPSQEYRDRLSVELAKLGARGVSVIVSSGDSGTGCHLCYYFEPSFPATSPYVTSVGSTTFRQDFVGPESAATFSGGGFSWYFEQPGYQAAVVTHYFATQPNLPNTHYYNPYGRGFPDVSALGVGYQVILDGKQMEYSGSATATATFAAVISLLNEIRVVHALPSLGFLNPWLYQVAHEYPDSFYDVTEGNNNYGCCGYTGFKCTTGVSEVFECTNSSVGPCEWFGHSQFLDSFQDCPSKAPWYAPRS